MRARTRPRAPHRPRFRGGRVALAAWTLAAADAPATEPGDVAAATRWAEWSSVVLPRIRAPQPATYSALLGAVATSPHARERQAAAAALGRVDFTLPWADDEIEHLRHLLTDDVVDVRRAAVYALVWARSEQVAALIGDVRIGGDRGVAQAVAWCWAYRKSADHTQPDPAAVSRLLTELIEVPQFGQSADDVDDMLAAFARRDPAAVVDFFLARVRREQASRVARIGGAGDRLGYWSERYEAVRHHGFQQTTEALRAGARYPSVVQQLLDAAAAGEGAPEGEPSVEAPALELLGRLAAWDDEIARGLLRLAEAGCSGSRVVADIVGAQPRDSCLLSTRSWETCSRRSRRATATHSSWCAERS